MMGSVNEVRGSWGGSCGLRGDEGGVEVVICQQLNV